MNWYIYDCVTNKINCWRIQEVCEANHIFLVSQTMINVKHLTKCYSICLTFVKILSSMLINILAFARMNQRLLSSNLTFVKMNQRLLSSNLTFVKMNQRLLSSNLTFAKMNNLAMLRLLKSFDSSRIAIVNRFYNDVVYTIVWINDKIKQLHVNTLLNKKNSKFWRHSIFFESYWTWHE